MRGLQTIERAHGKMRALCAPLLAVTLGGAMLGSESAEVSTDKATPYAMSVAAVAMGHEVEATITGRIETLHGEPLEVRSDPFGPKTGQYDDNREVQILCEKFGPGAPGDGDPDDFGKPPGADTTWYRLGDPASGAPFSPERYVSANPVFTKDPIPVCPPPR